MASITKEIAISAPAGTAWAALRDFAGVQRLAPGLMTDCQFDGDARIVTFASGRVARELLVDIDDEARRLVYAEPTEPFITRNASMQVFADGERSCRLVWIIDVLPNKFADLMSRNMDLGGAAIKRTLESSQKPQ